MKNGSVMQKKITLVGCGNIGSRHLQAISNLSDNPIVNIVEPNENAQSVAKNRLNEKTHNLKINWYHDIDELEERSDIVIIATQSPSRYTIIKKLLELGNTRFLIEKIICQSEDEYKEIQTALKKFQAKAWVNCTRRYSKTYQEIKKVLKNDNQVTVIVTGGNRGLGTNAIHYIDLFSWLNDNYNIKLNGDFLTNEIFPNKRGKEFVEFGGIIIGNINAAKLIILFLPINNIPFTVDIIGKDNRIIINESDEKLVVLKGKLNPKNEAKFPHISILSTNIVSDILEKDNCLLPTIDDSFFVHKELFKIFNKHLTKILKKEIKLCPIT